MVLVVTFYVPKILKTHDLKLFDIFSATQAMSDTDAILQACFFLSKHWVELTVD